MPDDITFTEGYLYHYSCKADQSFILYIFSLNKAVVLDHVMRQKQITTTIAYLEYNFLVKIPRIYFLLASESSM